MLEIGLLSLEGGGALNPLSLPLSTVIMPGIHTLKITPRQLMPSSQHSDCKSTGTSIIGFGKFSKTLANPPRIHCHGVDNRPEIRTMQIPTCSAGHN